MDRALTRIHVEHNPAGARWHLSLCKHLPVLPVDRRNDYDHRHGGGHGRGGGTCRGGEHERIGATDRAVDGRDVLLRRVRRRGGRRVRHHEQLLGIRAGHGVGAHGTDPRPDGAVPEIFYGIT